jgi:hypothetical protein
MRFVMIFSLRHIGSLLDLSAKRLAETLALCRQLAIEIIPQAAASP